MSESTPTSAAQIHELNVSCCVCAQPLVNGHCRPVRALRPGIAQRLRLEIPRPVENTELVCKSCISRLRVEYMLQRLESDRGALSALEADVARKAAEHSPVAEDLVSRFEQGSTRGERMADGVARVGGSWPFVVAFFGFILIWMAINAHTFRDEPFDPYPFILLNLVLSCLAAIQAPIIMMSQNRAAAKDRLQADQDFRVNLKAELEVAGLHEKVDHLLHAQWESLMEIQQAQLDLLAEINARTSSSGEPPASAPEKHTSVEGSQN